MKTNNITFDNVTPLQRYNSLHDHKEYIFDTSQKKVIIILDQVWQDLALLHKKRNSLLGKSLFSPPIPKGIYIWGSVGRGKSFLMDIFYNCLPYSYKRRVHFHEFINSVHKKLEFLKHKDNPLDIIGLELSKEVKILCFDEFYVNDIANAIILGNLLFSLIKNGIVIVATSNYEPNKLYTQGLNRSSFLSTIDFIYKNFNIIHLDGTTDYRLRSLVSLPVFYIPNSQENNKKLENLFNKISSGKTFKENYIEIDERKIDTIKHCECGIWFDFNVLCFTNRSKQDYLFLAKHYLYIFISDIRKLSIVDKDGARRFTWLIDILYDLKVKLFLTSSCNLEDIYMSDDFSQEFTRTLSRLIEMQSKNYLISNHLLLSDSNVLENIFTK